MRRLTLLLSASLLAFSVSACHPKITPAPPPLRPKSTGPLHPEGPPQPEGPKDCEPAKDTLPALTYAERRVSMADDLAARADKSIQSSKKADEPTRETLIEGAVEDLITALKADPYNVDATYELAATYAQIGRTQCSLNLLTRLIQMKDHPSRKDQVEGKLDHLLGRGKFVIDPDFDAIRSDDRFLELIRHI